MSDPDRDTKKSDAMKNFAGMLGKQKKDDKDMKKKILKDGIEKREKAEKGTIMSSKLVTQKLTGMRETAGMSSFVGTSGKIKSPKLKRGEFVEMLARELLLIGRDELKDNGGVVSVSKIRNYFEETRDNWELREIDIPQAIEYLVKKNMIPRHEKLDKNIDIIYFRPIELSQDIKQILIAAHGLEATKTNLREILGWNDARLDQGLKLLQNSGIAIVEDDMIFFPGM